MAEAIPLNSGPEPPAIFPSAILDSPELQTFLSEAARQLVEDVGGTVRGFLWAITLVGQGEVRNWASGSTKARDVDGAQSSFEDGPARAAVASREFIHVPDVAVERRWSGYAAAIAGQGVRSVLSIPMNVEWDISAALTLYATSPHAFTSEDVIRAGACARRMSTVCQLLLELARKAGAAITQTPLSVIEVGVWSLIREYGLNEESAMRYLQAVVHHVAISSPAALTVDATDAAPPTARSYGRTNSLHRATSAYPRTG
jgi:GAF domain-containing protein